MCNKFRSSVFWGTLLLVIGALILISTYFHISIPIFKTLVALLLIYLGIRIFTGSLFKKRSNTIMFGESKLNAMPSQRDYNIIFSSGEVDLSNTEFEPGKKIEINVIFGDGKVYLSKDKKYIIHMNSVFGQGRSPNGSTVNFGSNTFSSESASSETAVIIEANVVFGNMEITYK
ncbi:TPA: hypothetical protein DCW38_08155 [candidate division WOR-3 bacterium]|jgi:predicted membrane protein|uniref:Cell wall-active antibiotics response LiaF-like C-terminal domain-containing protein n=1 Tax=candidate division WOR-3 bacterium TaxID=2052148 RepID=A0A350HC68_UNCW3|nr:hypothetical protein [candidate division WOR-3 bacterium]